MLFIMHFVMIFIPNVCHGNLVGYRNFPVYDIIRGKGGGESFINTDSIQ